MFFVLAEFVVQVTLFFLLLRDLCGKCGMFIVVRLKEGAGVPQFVTAGSIVFTIQCNGNQKEPVE